MLNGNPHLIRLAQALQDYWDGSLGLENLHSIVSSVFSSLEGDVPKDFRLAIQRTDDTLELVRYGYLEANQREHAMVILKSLTSELAKLIG
jgi:hypothetical protein